MMNKEQLVAAVSENLNAQGFPIESKAQANRIVSATLEEIKKSVIEGEGVSIIGFGSFRTSERAATQCRNMQTGEMMEVPARHVVKFTPGAAFKNAVKDK